MTMLQTILFSMLFVVDTNAFAFVSTAKQTSKQTVALQMGLFDGVKSAFSAPALERTTLDAERETPIDRWMGWSVVSDKDQLDGSAVAADFIDAMDESNYVAVELSKPMGIVFEENDTEFGGIYVQSLKESGPATMSGLLKEGDQLVAVGTAKVSGMPFDDALAAIIESVGDQTKLVVFRGSAKQFYGPTGANREWVDEFVAKGGVPVSSA